MVHSCEPEALSLDIRRRRPWRWRCRLRAGGILFPPPPALFRGRRTPDLHPVVVIDRTDIELSGMRNLWDLLEGRDDLNAFGLHRPLSLKIVRLWSIGGYRAAVLINGRRITEDETTTWTRFPLAAVERIEISRDSAVVAQGPEALTGVVNIVLRNRFEGAEVETSGERPVHGGGETGHASAIWGGAWGGGHLTLGFDVFPPQRYPPSRPFLQPGLMDARRVVRRYVRRLDCGQTRPSTFGPDGPTAQSLGDCQDSEFHRSFAQSPRLAGRGMRLWPGQPGVELGAARPAGRLRVS